MLGASDEEVAIRFRFGRDGTAAPGDLIARPADAPPAPALGGRAVALLAGADVWAPGEVKSVRSQTQFLVELDQESDCAGQYARSYVWADAAKGEVLQHER